ncbi:MAG: hypothetical protein Q9227_006474 [Pyrenula ochraceoflavens]
MDASVKKQYLADNPPTVVRLEIRPHFEALTDDQKLYAHYISRAAFSGTRIVQRQISPESEPIFDLILALHRACSGDWKSLASKTGVAEEDVGAFLNYSAQFLGNGGNYKGFGDQKFIPRCSTDALRNLAGVSKECTQAFEKAMSVGGGIFETQNPAFMHLGFPEQGHMTTYYPDSPSITKAEIDEVGQCLEKQKLLLENTRLRKTSDGNFEVLIASGISNPPAADRDLKDATEFTMDSGKKIRLVFGDYLNEMAKIALNMKKAEQHGANETQRKMQEQYARSFGTGSIQAFKESQRLWIKDKGPVVESNIGFVETYRDPACVRGEWEGWVAMVNQERTKAFGKLVAVAVPMISKLPWPKDFEKDEFLKPDFTSLEVLTFASSGVPAGINIPNYDDIRQNEGFKNVSLGNVLSAKAPNEPIPFIAEHEQDVYRNNFDLAFEVQVGIHELLGHGTCKLLQETEPGKFNFDHANPPISPLTNKPVTTYYKPGQTWSGVFGPIASSFEECRAECVAMFLGCQSTILQAFGAYDANQEVGDVLYVMYLLMARMGIMSLESWDPKSKKWGQIHSQARFSIMKTFLDAGQGFLELKYTKDDLSDLTIHLDRSKIMTVGQPAVEKYLQKLHIYKSTADAEAAKKMYDETTAVDDWWGQKVRPQVIEKKVPRKVFVQANTVVGDDGKVTLKEYEPTVEGMIQSYAERDV